MIAAFGPILAIARMLLIAVDASISGSDTKPSNLSVNCERAQLKDVIGGDTSISIMKLSDNLPANMRDKVG